MVLNIIHFNQGSITQFFLAQRRKIQGTAASIAVPKSTLHERLKSVSLQSQSSYLKLTLTADNCRKRVVFCLEHIDMRREMFTNMFDEIHID